jgi:hypothetical protein
MKNQLIDVESQRFIANELLTVVFNYKQHNL